MRVYLVICNGRVSSEGYKTIEQAREFIKTRYYSQLIWNKERTKATAIMKHGCAMYYEITDIKVV